MPAATINPVTYQDIGVQSGFLIVSAGSGDTINIYNGDITNTLLVSPNPTPSLSNSLPIQPLTNATIDGSRAQYASALSGTCATVTVGAAAQLSPSPAQIAEQINALGLAKDTSVNNPAYGPVPVSYGPSKDSSVQATNSVLGTGIALPVGAAKDVTLTTGIALPVGAAKDTSVSGLATSIPNNISTTGVPLLAASNVLANPGSQTFTSGQIRIPVNNATVDQISYEISIALQAAATGETTPFMLVTLSWSDATSGQLVAQESWVLGACTGTTNQNFYSGVGRCKASQLKVTWKWLGAVTSGSCQIVVTETSRVYLRDDFRTVGNFNGMASFTSGTYDLDGGCVLNTNPSIGANSGATRSMPLYHGTVFVAAQPPEAFTVSIQNAAESTANGAFPTQEIWQASAVGGGVINSMVVLPRSNCTITLSNTSATLATFPLQIIVAEQEV